MNGFDEDSSFRRSGTAGAIETIIPKVRAGRNISWGVKTDCSVTYNNACDTACDINETSSKLNDVSAAFDIDAKVAR